MNLSPPLEASIEWLENLYEFIKNPVFPGPLKVKGAFKIKRYRQAAEPTTSQMVIGELAIWSDSDDDRVYLAYYDEDTATVVTTELT